MKNDQIEFDMSEEQGKESEQPKRRGEARRVAFEVCFDPPKATHQGGLGLMVRGKGFFLKGLRVFPLSQISFGVKPSSPAGKAKKEWIRRLTPHAPDSPFSGPLALTLVITWPYLKSHKKAVKAFPRMPHFGRPDLDNVEKLILDAMTKAGFWGDDGQVCDKHSVKCYGQKPGLTVVIEEMPLPKSIKISDLQKSARIDKKRS